MNKLIPIIALLLSSLSQAAEHIEPNDTGEVRVPLTVYSDLIEQTRDDPRPAPAAYAIGQSQIKVQLSEQEERTTASVEVTLIIETFEKQWTLVPILPTAVALKSATVDGIPVALVQGPEGLSWSTNKAATATLRLHYGVDAQRSATGFVLPVPTPRAAATALDIAFPATGLDLAVVPAADLTIREEEKTTYVNASVPATTSVLITWRAPSKRSHALSRASYKGELQDKALLWKADYQVEVFTGELITLPLLPTNVTLNDIKVDGQSATVLIEDHRFATTLQGRGLHTVQVEFQVPVIEQNGPPQATLHIPQVPVSSFELFLPGRKELSVTPQANIITTEREGSTAATVYMPMGKELTFSWVEAIPEDMRTEVRANASLYHALHAEEGVLHGHALIAYEITHGESNLLELDVPLDVQVNRIEAPGVSDWSVSETVDPTLKRVTIFLDRAIQNDYLLQVFYERLLGSGVAEPVPAPLLRAVNVHRQRGMVALLTGPELTLEPTSAERLSAVGENQLPAFVRNQLQQTVAHTYKYIDAAPALVVQAKAPERQQGKFDAQVDTLISIGEVTLKGTATVALNVKSGSLMALQLKLPDDLNVLAVSGPSLRNHQVQESADGQVIDMEFTREMEGQFRMQVNYERIMADSAAEISVPTVSVADAEVEHGRIAVEALTAVEVQAARAEQLSALDINELPQQLVLKTTNPILLAYKYVHAAPQLALTITRHQEIDVQVAAIERAYYQTLYTRDGLAVTTARFDVRNSRRQFLHLKLPPKTEIWSVFVDGQAEKPAQADSLDAVLIKMINSASGFPVEIVYASEVDALGTFGSVAGQLPRPDMIVTHSHWDVFLPTGPTYREPDGNLDIVMRGRLVNPRNVAEMASSQASRDQAGQPLRLNVPSQGVQFSFEKLYANQSPEAAEFSIAYVAEEASRFGLALSILGVLLLWAGIIVLANRRLPRGLAIASIVLGVVVLLGSIGYLGANTTLASGLALLIALVLGIGFLIRRWLAWRRRDEEEEVYSE